MIGLETALGVGITYLVKNDVMDLGTLIERMTESPARLMGWDSGRLEEGAKADFVLFDPDREWVVRADGFQSRSRNSSFIGETLTGKVVSTFLGGRLTWREPEE